MEFIVISKNDLKEVVSEILEQINLPEREEEFSDKLLTTEEVAQLFSVSKGTVANWRKKGKIKSYVIGRSIRYSYNHVMKALGNYNSNMGKM